MKYIFISEDFSCFASDFSYIRKSNAFQNTASIYIEVINIYCPFYKIYWYFQIKPVVFINGKDFSFIYNISLYQLVISEYYKVNLFLNSASHINRMGGSQYFLFLLVSLCYLYLVCFNHDIISECMNPTSLAHWIFQS